MRKNIRKLIRINKEWQAAICCNYIENVVLVSLIFKGKNVISEKYMCFFNDYTCIVYQSVIEVFKKEFNVDVIPPQTYTKIKSFEKIAPIDSETIRVLGNITYSHEGVPEFIIVEDKQ